jgi:hypothetical protein
MRIATLLVAALSVAFPVPHLARAQQAAASATSARDSTRMSAVTYISGQSVYVGAGRSDGVREGMALEVLRGGLVIATIRATYLASRSSSGEIVTSTAAPVIGDSVRYHPALDQEAVVVGTDSSTDAEASRRSPSWRRPIRGHVGVRYFAISQPNIDGLGSLMQPSADVYLEATRLGGTPIGLIVDGRSRRTIGSRQIGTLDERTLIYQVSLSVSDPGSGARLSVGRQYSSALSSVSLFDGVTAEFNRAHWGFGGFGGVQPDVATMGYSTEVREAGGYLQVHNAPDESVPWSVTTGAVSSRDLGQLNREFGFAQVTWTSQIVSLFATQEIDINRGWKRAAGEPAVSPTSTFATLTVRPNDEISFQGGIDNRRNVRLYRDYVSPETEFDDAFREGIWGGASLVVLRTLRLGADARFAQGGSAGDAAYYTGSLSVGPSSRLSIDARLRSTSYSTDAFTGWMHAFSAGTAPFGDELRFEVNGGFRTQQLKPGVSSAANPGLSAGLNQAQWFGGSVDVSLGRSWYVLLSGTRDGTGVDLTNQFYGSLVFRF